MIEIISAIISFILIIVWIFSIAITIFGVYTTIQISKALKEEMITINITYDIDKDDKED